MIKYKNILLLNNSSNKNKIFNKNLTISESLLNKIFLIYNGKEFKKLLIDRAKIGFKFGEFISTKKHTRKSKIIKKK